MKTYRKLGYTRNSPRITCGCFLLVMLANIIAGSWSVNYLLLFIFNQTLPFVWSALIGLIAGQVTIPVAVVVAILHYFNII